MLSLMMIVVMLVMVMSDADGAAATCTRAPPSSPTPSFDKPPTLASCTRYSIRPRRALTPTGGDTRSRPSRGSPAGRRQVTIDNGCGGGVVANKAGSATMPLQRCLVRAQRQLP